MNKLLSDVARILANQYVELLYSTIYSPLIWDMVNDITAQVETGQLSEGALRQSIRELEQNDD